MTHSPIFGNIHLELGLGKYENVVSRFKTTQHKNFPKEKNHTHSKGEGKFFLLASDSSS